MSWYVQFTPARRWSFLVGANEKSHTAQSRLVSILANDKQAPTLEEIEKSFDIESVTKEFFLEYRGLFLHTKEELDRVIKKHPKIKADFEAKGVDTVNFAKKLLGQIIFLYFLQKKGWFGVGRDDDWGTGSKHFLRELFKRKHGNYSNFFNNILEPLFYDALRTDRSHDDGYYSHFNCKIPFLNGGLFDPIGNYDWDHTDILLPDRLFSNNEKTKEGDTGTGILDVFDRYNFTVKEDEPLEKEVAIDPELLGKSYEKFNAIRPDNFDEFRMALKSGKKGDENKFNKKFGVYYTPREIVHYMCQQSLINYLATELEEKTSKEDIEALIHIGELVSENEVAALIKDQSIKEGKQKTSGYKLQLPESIRSNAALIDQKLADITVCDPAVGSGAFPVGMMSEIVRTRNVLSVFLNDSSRTSYEFKRRCIEHSLYGVDIDPGAVEIAKLRLWLSLVVDEEDIKNIKPLPNLEYKVVCGNSLLGYPYRPQGLDKIETLKERFLNETRPTVKVELHKHIDEIIYGLFEDTKKSLGYQVSMDFKINFSEVFHFDGGFDVVIANPPYIKARDNKDKETRKQIARLYVSTYKMWDIYIPFIEQGLKIKSKTGLLTFIIPVTLGVAEYSMKIVDLIEKQYHLSQIHFFPEMYVFENVAVKNKIIFINNKSNEKLTKRIQNIPSFPNYKQIDSMNGTDKYIFKLSEYEIPTDETVPLGQICVVSYGLRLNSDKSDNKYKFKKKELLSNTQSKSYKRKYVEGKFISKYKIKKELFVEWDTERCPNKLVRPTYPELYEHPKILLSRQKKVAAYSDQKHICDNTIIISVLADNLRNVDNKNIRKYYQNLKINRRIIEENSKNFNLKYILTIINSKLIEYHIKYYSKGKIDFYPDDWKNIPIKKLSSSEQKPYIDLANRILNITKDNDYLQTPQKQAKVKILEREIDQMVYKLYDLTTKEIAIIEGDKK